MNLLRGPSSFALQRDQKKLLKTTNFLEDFSSYKIDTCNSANSIKVGKLLKMFKLTPNNKQNIVQEA